jgi:hypothetical protein
MKHIVLSSQLSEASSPDMQICIGASLMEWVSTSSSRANG